MQSKNHPPALGSELLSKLTPAQVQLYLNRMQSEGLCANTVRKHYMLLHNALEHALGVGEYFFSAPAVQCLDRQLQGGVALDGPLGGAVRHRAADGNIKAAALGVISNVGQQHSTQALHAAAQRPGTCPEARAGIP